MPSVGRGEIERSAIVVTMLVFLVGIVGARIFLKSLQKPAETSIRAKRRTRLLPRELRSLDERFYGAYLRLLEYEYGARRRICCDTEQPRRREINPEPLVTAKVGVEDVAQAFKDMASPEMHAKVEPRRS